MRPTSPFPQQQQHYRSTPDSRSSVLNRAREYTRRIENEERRRSKSSDNNRNKTPKQGGLVSPSSSSSSTSYREASIHSTQPRRQTTSPGSFDQTPRSTRDRSLANVEKENSRNHFSSPESNKKLQHTMDNKYGSTDKSAAAAAASTMDSPGQEFLATRRSRISAATTNATRDENATAQQQRPPPQQQHHQPQHQGEPVVSPELLVDALSGHEDGLLAIAERLMEHYDSGYDAMGEAIIDAFADVQKLFQHVVEAAHMEGAAFEASRREEEMKQLRIKSSVPLGDDLDDATRNTNNDGSGTMSSPSGPVRHDEFIDQDVKDCLNEAIRNGVTLKDQNKLEECYELYEQACQSASSLLPVDSDHRGRLQLSIARAESMTPDRGCAILRYAMDDVLRSGLRAGKVPLPDPSKRADVVLSKPKGHSSMNGALGANTVQSTEEALNSLKEEMKEILDAPVYKDTPLQDVARRFWTALQENQKLSSKNEERLEHNLGKLKGDFLLARAEWEEKLTQAHEQTEIFKRKYLTVRDGKETSLLEDARNGMANFHRSMNESGDQNTLGSLGASNSLRSATNRPEFQKGVESVASMGSSLAQHAKTLVGSFACAGSNDRTGQVLTSERAATEWRGRRTAAAAAHSGIHPKGGTGQLPPGLEMSATSASTRSYRDAGASHSTQLPRQMDI